MAAGVGPARPAPHRNSGRSGRLRVARTGSDGARRRSLGRGIRTRSGRSGRVLCRIRRAADRGGAGIRRPVHRSGGNFRPARRDRPPLVIVTPRSSWWQSPAERGGGLVRWLESLRALLAAPPACDVVFTANSGHELGHLGLDDFVARRPGWDRPAAQGGAIWIHYGANLGAVGGQLSLVSPEADLRELAITE